MAIVSHLTPLSVPVLPVDDAVIDALRDLLGRAERGEIQGIAYATIESDGMGTVLSSGTGYKGEGVCQNVHAMLGTLEVLKSRLFAGFDLV